MSEERIKISGLDLTKQTVTLGLEDNPMFSVMKGHVDELTYVKAFRAEGWNNNGTELTEEQWKEEAESEMGMLDHTYGKLIDDYTLKFNLEKDDEGAEPMTVRHW
jgi:hypothetical protein